MKSVFLCVSPSGWYVFPQPVQKSSSKKDVKNQLSVVEQQPPKMKELIQKEWLPPLDLKAVKQPGVSEAKLETEGGKPTKLIEVFPRKVFTFEKTLASGVSGTVYLAKFDNKQVAIKMIKRDTHNWQEKVLKEAAVLDRLKKHEGIAKLAYPNILESDFHYFIVMEYIEGKELLKVVNDCLSVGTKELEKKLRAYFKQMIEIVKYCLDNKIAHGDLKPDNWMVDDKDNIKLVDFGAATDISKTPLSTKIHGSPLYSAPEELSFSFINAPVKAFCEHNLNKTEVFSLGAVFSCLLTDDVLDLPTSVTQLSLAEIAGKQADLSRRQEIWERDGLSSEAQDLLTKMLEPEPTKRISIEDVLKHKWFIG